MAIQQCTNKLAAHIAGETPQKWQQLQSRFDQNHIDVDAQLRTPLVHNILNVTTSGYSVRQANDDSYKIQQQSIEPNPKDTDPTKNYPIVIYTLGCFSVFKDGQLINGQGNSQHKPHELLKLLIALGGKSVGEIRISDALWPEADGDVAHTSFSVTLHRIRKLMGIKVIHLNDGHLSIDGNLCWIDVWELQKVLSQIKDTINSTDVNMGDIVKLCNKAIRLYHGHFLGNEDEQPWFIAFREQLKSKLIRNLLLACDFLESQGRCDLAMDYYRKGIEVEQLSEEFYLRLMKCYISHGRNVEAISIYQQCFKVFNALTGCEPSEETTSMYQRVQNSL